MAKLALAVLLLACAPAVAQPTGYSVPYPAAKQGGQYMVNYYIPPAPSTTPWAPAWSPDGKWLAVAMYGSIWRVDPESGKATELTYNRKYHSSPAFSPDGRWMVYTADDGSAINLEAINLTTGEIRELTTGREIFLDPVFSPDGNRLAYVSTQPNGYFQIYVREVRNGDWAGEPTAITRDRRYPRERLYFGAWDGHMQPAWTPDGKYLVLLSNRDVPLGSGHLWLAPVEADGINKAVPVLQEQSLYRSRPDVSRDGRRIVYASTAGAADQFTNLYVTPINGGAPYKLTFGDYDHFHPRWSPDGEWIAFIHNRSGLPSLALLETYGGARREIKIEQRQWKRPMGKVHVRVIDSETKRILHSRIHGVAADGKFYPPADAYARRGRAFVPSFHTTGEYTADVPPGPMTIEAVHGFQYWPGKAEVVVEPGKTVEVTIPLRRMAASASQGWFSGSTHVHMNYGGNLHNTPSNLVMMARAEGMDVIMDLAANKDNRILDHQHFAGGGEHPFTKNMTDVKLHIGEEYRPPFYGHVFFLGLRDHLISPFTTGYEGTGIESLYPSNTDMFRKASAQGALNGYVHPYFGDRDPLEGDLGGAKAFPVDAALGTVQCLEWSSASRAGLAVWHHALNNDFAIAPTGGEDSITNLHWTKLVGGVRTFVQSGTLSIDAWIESLRKGRSYFTTGPILEFSINGKGPGESLKLTPDGRITLSVRARSIAPLSRVIVHRNGSVFRELPIVDKNDVSWKSTIDVGSDSAWYSLYVEGPPFRLLDAEFPQAATNAIRVYVGDKPIRNAESARYFQRWIDKLDSMAKDWPWWRNDREKRHVSTQFDEARRIYVRLENEAK